MGNSKSQPCSPHLTKDDIDFLVASTNNSEIAVKQWYEMFLDNSPTGRIDRAQFDKMYHTLCRDAAMPPNNFSDHVFRAFDTDRDGLVDFREFMLAVNINSQGATFEEKIK